MRRIKTFLEHDKTVTKFSKKKELLDQIVLCAIAMLASLLMSIMNIIQHSYMMLIFTGGSTIIMLISIIVGHLTKNSTMLKVSFSVLFFVLFSYYVVIGGNDGFAALWMILAPYVLLIAVDFKIGFICSTGYLIVLLLFFKGPLYPYLQFTYSKMFLARFPMLYSINFAFATFSSIRLRNYQYELIRVSAYDLSTGLLNRNSYNKYLETFSPNGIQTMTCVYIDVNGLHDINNRFGHDQGDIMLRRIAVHCKHFFNYADIYRIGGDEYVIIAENKRLYDLCKNLEHMCRDIEDDGYSIAYGISYQSEHYNIEKLVSDADIEMLKNKNEYYKTRHKR